MSLAEIQLNSPVEQMRLTLTYEGPLHAVSNSDTRVAEKHDIRRQLHPQLLDVWQSHPELGETAFRTQTLTRLPDSERVFPLGNNTLQLPRSNIGNFLFVPLISHALWMVCDLDILFLRREPLEPGGVINTGGDLDNRLKTLFDALRMPEHNNEIPKTATPAKDEAPFACLLESDRLITGFRVDTETLLGPLDPHNRANVKLVIRVTAKVQKITYWNITLGTDL